MNTLLAFWTLRYSFTEVDKSFHGLYGLKRESSAMEEDVFSQESIFSFINYAQVKRTFDAHVASDSDLKRIFIKIVILVIYFVLNKEVLNHFSMQKDFQLLAGCYVLFLVLGQRFWGGLLFLLYASFIIFLIVNPFKELIEYLLMFTTVICFFLINKKLNTWFFKKMANFSGVIQMTKGIKAIVPSCILFITVFCIAEYALSEKHSLFAKIADKIMTPQMLKTDLKKDLQQDAEILKNLAQKVKNNYQNENLKKKLPGRISIPNFATKETKPFAKERVLEQSEFEKKVKALRQNSQKLDSYINDFSSEDHALQIDETLKIQRDLIKNLENSYYSDQISDANKEHFDNIFAREQERMERQIRDISLARKVDANFQKKLEELEQIDTNWNNSLEGGEVSPKKLQESLLEQTRNLKEIKEEAKKQRLYPHEKRILDEKIKSLDRKIEERKKEHQAYALNKKIKQKEKELTKVKNIKERELKVKEVSQLLEKEQVGEKEREEIDEIIKNIEEEDYRKKEQKEKKDAFDKKLKNFLLVLCLFILIVIGMHLFKKKKTVSKRIEIDESVKQAIRDEFAELSKSFPNFMDEVKAHYKFFHSSMNAIHYEEGFAPPALALFREFENDKKIKQVAYVMGTIFNDVEFAQRIKFSAKEKKIFRSHYRFFIKKLNREILS